MSNQRRRRRQHTPRCPSASPSPAPGGDAEVSGRDGYTVSEGFHERFGFSVVGRSMQPKKFRRWLADQVPLHEAFGRLTREEAAQVLWDLEQATAQLHHCTVAELRQQMLADLGLPPICDAEFERVYIEGL